MDERCLICAYEGYESYHSIEKHSEEQILAWVNHKRARDAALKGWELRNAYKLVAEDISKRPRNIIRLMKQLKG